MPQNNEEELTQYSTDARKVKKLRRKFGLSVSALKQKQVKADLLAAAIAFSIAF